MNQDEYLQAIDSNNGYSTMGVSWESVWGLRESVFSQFFASRSRELRSCWVQTPKQTPNRLPIGCPEGTFPYFRVAISAVKSVKCVSSRSLITQRSLVQIQPPQPNKSTAYGILNLPPTPQNPTIVQTATVCGSAGCFCCGITICTTFELARCLALRLALP